MGAGKYLQIKNEEDGSVTVYIIKIEMIFWLIIIYKHLKKFKYFKTWLFDKCLTISDYFYICLERRS